MMTTWDKIREALKMVAIGIAERIDGNGFKVYRVGYDVRVDITGNLVKEIIEGK